MVVALYAQQRVIDVLRTHRLCLAAAALRASAWCGWIAVMQHLAVISERQAPWRRRFTLSLPLSASTSGVKPVFVTLPYNMLIRRARHLRAAWRSGGTEENISESRMNR